MRVAVSRMGKIDDKYMIRLNCDEEDKIFDDILSLNAYVDKKLKENYKEDYSMGLSETFLELISLKFQLKESDEEDLNLIMKHMSLAEILDDFHINMYPY